MAPQRTTALEWDAWQLRIANDAAGVALWSWNVDTDLLTMDGRAFDLWGVTRSGSITFEELSSRIHPEDLDRVRAAFAATREHSVPYETDFRILHDNHVRWVSARGRGGDEGMVARVMFGIFLDVSARKSAEEAREMITSEMNHRIKNLFSIASALTGIASRSTSTKEAMERDLTQRLAALSAAHELVRPGFHEQKKAAPLSELLAALLKPYVEESSHENRVRITAPGVLVGESSSTAMALIVHELATNAIKYGALSTPAGALDVSCAEEDDDVVVVWKETGGPPIAAPIKQRGFGSGLVARSVSGQLKGSIDVQWPSSGALIQLRINKARLGA